MVPPCNHMSARMQGLDNPFQAARYHSLVIDQDGFPESELEVTARTEDGTIMAVRHKRLPHIQVSYASWICVYRPLHLSGVSRMTGLSIAMCCWLKEHSVGS